MGGLLTRGGLFPRLLFFTRPLGVLHRRPTVRIGLLGEARRRLGRSWVRPNNFASSRLVLVLRVRWRVLCPTAFTSVAPAHIHAPSETASRGRMRWHRNAPACVDIPLPSRPFASLAWPPGMCWSRPLCRAWGGLNKDASVRLSRRIDRLAGFCGLSLVSLSSRP